MAAPAIPTNFNIQQGNGQVLLTWDLVAGAVTYPIYRSLDGVTFTLVSNPAVTSYLDTTVTVGTQYFYQIASQNVSGTSPTTSSQSIVPTLQAQMSLGQLRLLSQQRADRVNSNFVTLPEWNTYINQSAFELYDLLTTLYEDYYVATPILFTTNGTSAQYTLPDGAATFTNATTGASFVAPPFYKLLGVDCGLNASSNAWVTLHKFEFIQRNRYVYPQITSNFLGVFNLKYRVLGNNLEFIPTPSGGQYIRLWYIPRMTQLLRDSDILDGVSGWTEYIVVDAAIKALTKEESDTSALMAQKQALLDRIQSTAMNRDAGEPDTISDTRNSGGRLGGPGYDGSYGGY